MSFEPTLKRTWNVTARHGNAVSVRDLVGHRQRAREDARFYAEHFGRYNEAAACFGARARSSRAAQLVSEGRAQSARRRSLHAP